MIYNLQDRYKQLIAILWRRLIKSSSLGVKSHLNQFDINYCFPYCILTTKHLNRLSLPVWVTNAFAGTLARHQIYIKCFNFRLRLIQYLIRFVIGWVRNVAGTSSKITRIWFNLNAERAPGKQITWQFGQSLKSRVNVLDQRRCKFYLQYAPMDAFACGSYYMYLSDLG